MLYSHNQCSSRGNLELGVGCSSQGEAGLLLSANPKLEDSDHVQAMTEFGRKLCKNAMMFHQKLVEDLRV